MTEPLTPAQTAAAVKQGIGDFGFTWMADKATRERGKAELGLRERALEAGDVRGRPPSQGSTCPGDDGRALLFQGGGVLLGVVIAEDLVADQVKRKRRDFGQRRVGGLVSQRATSIIMLVGSERRSELRVDTGQTARSVCVHALQKLAHCRPLACHPGQLGQLPGGLRGRPR